MAWRDVIPRLVVCAALFAVGGTGAGAPVGMPPDPTALRITVLYDAFGNAPAMQRDWGYAALIEYGGRRILFDTGNDAEILAGNADAKGVDLSKLDAVVMSHRHGDHMGGLAHLLSVNPRVPIYAPEENFGVYGFSLPSTFYRRDPSLPADQRYYGGAPPALMTFGTAWPGANFRLVDTSTEIAPGVHVIALVSEKPTTLELRELSLAIETPDGLVIVVGCSHPGIDRIVEAARKIADHVRLIAGGMHLVTAEDAEVDRVVALLQDTYAVDYVAPGHCTGEPAFAELRRAFGDRYVFAGLGSVISAGADVRSAPGSPAT